MWPFSRTLIPEAADESESPLEQRHKALVYQEEAKRVAKLTLQYPRIETGGSLFGYWTHSGSPIISIVSGPGRGSRHNPTSFYQDETYLRDLGTELYDKHGMQHIGEWHSHHLMRLNEPSQGDAATILSGMRQRGWSRFLLLITTIEDSEEGLVLENYFLFSETGPAPEPLRVLQLPGSSPFRTEQDVAREEPMRPLPQVAWRPGPFTPGLRKAVREVFPDAWFTSTDARGRLAKIARDFNAAGIECRMVPSEEGRELQLLLGEVILRLGPGFPDEAPEWLGAERPKDLESWSASTDLVAWFLRANSKYSDEASTYTDNGGRDNETDNST